MKKALLIAGAITMASAAWGLNIESDTLYYSSGGIVATYDWNNADTWLSWEIQPIDETDLWSYEYTWHTSGADLSHLLLEVTEEAVAEDFTDWEGAVGTGFGFYDPADPGNSNPGLPGSVYAFKITPGGDCNAFTFSFVTWHAPVWGDFFAKDGKQGGAWCMAYNAGFLADDANDGYHIPRPNGREPWEPVPDGGSTVALLGGVLLGLGALKRMLGGR